MKLKSRPGRNRLMQNPFKNNYTHLILYIILFILLNLSLLIIPVAGAATEETRYFPETGQTVGGKFLAYWLANGGLPVYGYPITEARPEVDPETGQTFLTQWFERNRFELHPENAGTAYEVLTGLLGKDLRREALTVDPNFKKTNAKHGYTFYAQTGHNMSKIFQDYWFLNGGLARFGLPISEEYRESLRDPSQSGPATEVKGERTYLVQWFERARFEYHPENPSPYNVLLGLLGNEIKRPNQGGKFLWQLREGLNSPVTVAVDQVDNLYVANYGKDQPGTIRKLNRTGQFQMEIRLEDARHHAWNVTVDSQGNIFVLDWFLANPANPLENSSVCLLKYDWLGKFQFKFNCVEGDDPFNYRMDPDRDGNLFVSNSYQGKIKKYNPQGQLIGEFGNYRVGDGPIALKVDSRGNIFTLVPYEDGIYTRAKVQKLNPAGEPVKEWTSQGNPDPKLYVAATFGSQLTLDSQDNLYVEAVYYEYLDREPHPVWTPLTLEKFDTEGNYNGENFYLGGTGQGEGAGQIGRGNFEADGQGNLYVVDPEFNRIEKFRLR